MPRRAARQVYPTRPGASRVWVEKTGAGGWRLGCEATGPDGEHTRRLWQEGTLGALAESGLLAEFEPVRARGDVFTVRTVGEAVPLSPAEWCGELWRAAAISMLRLLQESSRRDLTLTSVHPRFMLLAPGCRPVYARPGAIAPASPLAAAASLRAFADLVLLPLLLCSTGHAASLRALVASGDSLAPAAGFPDLAEAARLACEPRERTHAGVYADLLDLAEATAIPHADTFWSRYYRRDWALDGSEQLPYKNFAVARILESADPASVLDLASNAGWYARLAASRGKRVIALDNDETCVDRLFAAASAETLSITPVLSDLFLSHALHLAQPRRGLTAQARFASELVLALAITHHMTLSPPWLTFAEVAELLRSYTSRYLLTEFVSFEPESQNPYTPAALPGCEDWYRLDNFLGALRRRFGEVVLVPGPPGRQLVLAER